MEWLPLFQAIGDGIDHYGLPLVVLGLFVAAVYKTAPWIKGLVESVVSKVIEFLDRQARTMEELARAVFLIQASLDSFKTEVKTQFTEVRNDIDDLKERRRYEREK